MILDFDRDKDFEQLFGQLYFPLRTYAYRFVRSVSTAEDMVQDAFEQLWANRSAIKNRQAWTAYLFTSVRNNSINYLKKKQVERKHISVQDDIESLYQSAIAEMQGHESIETVNRIKDSIHTLPDTARRIFLLSRKYNMRNSEIADFLNISIKTVEKHITKALQHLRGDLSRA
jgi:RNA polymerase sigma-70 factor (ECF subfamily)